jgi:hypothetical protein
MRFPLITAALITTAAAALAAPPDQIYEFTVTADTVTGGTGAPFPFCGTECTVTESAVAYKLATLTLTHDALTRHTAELSDMTNPPTDDGRVLTFAVETLPDPPNPIPGLGGFAPNSLSIPIQKPGCPDRLFQTSFQCPGFERFIHGDGYALNLMIVGDHLSGSIEIGNIQSHGDGCSISMTGHNNNWAGSWRCVAFGAGPLHHFTATSTRVSKIAGK